MVSNHTHPKSLSTRLRARRMRYLDEALTSCGPGGCVLADLGGTASFWEMNLPELRYKERLRRIDIFNLDGEPPQERILSGVVVRIRRGDGTGLPEVTDGLYDIAFSNSVIEHVGHLANQLRFADEIRRIAGRFVLQTPCRGFPLEPHFYVPFFAQMPLGLRAWLHQHFTLGWLERQPDALKARAECDQIRLLTGRELQLLFPGARLHREFFMGCVKSFIVTGGGR
jgi:SAM-dependent methyltransferase